MRRTQFAKDEYYHIFNRGTDKRIIFSEEKDFKRFLQGIIEFNNLYPIGSIHQCSFLKNQLRGQASKLVEIICYCLNPNHFHLMLKQIASKGIEKYMQRLGTGYVMYFNEKNKRNGSLFQDPYKAVHITTNEQLLHTSTYINLNNKIHRLGGQASKSSWGEYLGRENGFCKKDIILNQFENATDYKNFAKNTLPTIQERKELKKLLLD